MSNTFPRARDAESTASAHSFLATIAGLVGLIIAFLVLDLFLARIERVGTRKQAADLYVEGRTLLAAGHAREAADRLAGARSLDRNNITYALTHTQAMLAEGRAAEAEQSLTELLVRAQNDGPVNLTMARLLTAGGRRIDAKAFYHRAIYGRWGSDSLSERLAARFELINLLAEDQAPSELLAELLPLQSSRSDSVALLRRIAPLYRRAGAPSRATEAYRQLIRRSPDDADAYAGLGDVALSQGQFRTARAAFADGARLHPADSALVLRLRLADTLIALDPNARGLGDAVRLKRSRVLLARALALTSACAVAAGAPAWRGLRDSAHADLRDGPPRTGTVASTERTRALVNEIWHARVGICPASATPTDDVLSRLVDVPSP